VRVCVRVKGYFKPYIKLLSYWSISLYLHLIVLLICLLIRGYWLFYQI